MDREALVSSIKGKFDLQITEPQRSEFAAILDGMTDEQLRLYDKLSDNHAQNMYHLAGKGAAYYPGDKKVRMDIDDAKWERYAGTGQTAAWHTKFHEECHQLDHILAEQGIEFYDLDGGIPSGIHKITDTSTVTGGKLLEAIKNDIVAVINRAVEEKNAVRVSLDLDPCIKPIKSLSRIPADTKDALIFWLRDNYKTDKDRALISLFTDAVGLSTDGRITPYKQGFWGHEYSYNKDRDGNGATSETFANFGAIFFGNNEEERTAIQQLMPSTWQVYSEIFAMIEKLAAYGNDISYP